MVADFDLVGNITYESTFFFTTAQRVVPPEAICAEGSLGCAQTAVFFIQHAIKFPDVVHAGKPHPHNEISQAQVAHDNFWDFLLLTTERDYIVM